MSLRGLVSGRGALFIALGALIGFAFYYYVGCSTGTCMITSSPYLSTLYGGFMGWLISETKP